jgi:hypothetical protein
VRSPARRGRVLGASRPLGATGTAPCRGPLSLLDREVNVRPPQLAWREIVRQVAYRAVSLPWRAVHSSFALAICTSSFDPGAGPVHVVNNCCVIASKSAPKHGREYLKT